MSGSRLVLVVAAVLIDAHRRVLLAQRPKGKKMAGLWEFPGGKVEAGETPEHALARELREELRIQVEPATLCPITFASHGYPDFHLLMPVYACQSWRGTPEGADGQNLSWVAADALGDLPMPEADIPLIEPVRRIL